MIMEFHLQNSSFSFCTYCLLNKSCPSIYNELLYEMDFLELEYGLDGLVCWPGVAGGSRGSLQDQEGTVLVSYPLYIIYTYIDIHTWIWI